MCSVDGMKASEDFLDVTSPILLVHSHECGAHMLGRGLASLHPLLGLALARCYCIASKRFVRRCTFHLICIAETETLMCSHHRIALQVYQHSTIRCCQVPQSMNTCDKSIRWVDVDHSYMQAFVLAASAEEATLLAGRLGQRIQGEEEFLMGHLFPKAAALPATPRHTAFLALLRRLPELDPRVLDMLPKVRGPRPLPRPTSHASVNGSALLLFDLRALSHPVHHVHKPRCAALRTECKPKCVPRVQTRWCA